MEYINQMMEKFAAKHSDHISMCGDDNNKRLSNGLYVGAADAFSYGVGNRNTSIRIPTRTFAASGKGYIEDRRPGSNMDPYVVTSMLVNAGVNAEDLSEDLTTAFTNWKKFKA
jgi:glutamine synthetase